MRQLNGLASWYDRSEQVWRNKPIGYLWTDRLRGYDTKTHPRTYMPINGASGPGLEYRPRHRKSGAARVLANGLTAEDVERRIAPALEAIRRINALSDGPEGGAGLPYPFMGFGRNSNSFFRTLAARHGLRRSRLCCARADRAGRRRGLLLSSRMLSHRCEAHTRRES